MSPSRMRRWGSWGSPAALRTNAVTACPLASAWETISLPVRPLAPKTMIFMSSPVIPFCELQPPHYTWRNPYQRQTSEQGEGKLLMSEELKTTEEALQKLIGILRDSHQGFLELEKNLKNEQARALFRQQTLERAGFAAELEGELHHFGVKDVKAPVTTTAGKVHRAWGELKARLGGGDHALLATAEKGEDEAKEDNDEALSGEDFPLPLREILLRQQRHILGAHDRVKALRDRLVA